MINFSNIKGEEMIKSIMPVQVFGGWDVRQRNQDGTELFLNACYTLAQAQVAADSLRRHLANGGETYAQSRGEA